MPNIGKPRRMLEETFKYFSKNTREGAKKVSIESMHWL